MKQTHSHSWTLRKTCFLMCISGLLFLALGSACSQKPDKNTPVLKNVPTQPAQDKKIDPMTELERQAVQHIQKEEYAKAAEVYNAILKKSPGNELALYQLAVLADVQDDNEVSKKLYTELLQKKPDDAYAIGGLAWIEFKLGNYQASLDLSQKALKIQPNLVQARYNSALATLALGEIQNAMMLYTEAVAMETGTRFTDGAIDDLDYFLKEHKNDNSAFSWYALATLYEATGKKNLEKKALENFISLEGSHPMAAKAREKLAAL